jgi:uncharacterized protein with beta-barrel porin domain
MSSSVFAMFGAASRGLLAIWVKAEPLSNTQRTEQHTRLPALLLWTVALMIAPAAAQAQNLIVNGGLTTNGGDDTQNSAPPWTAVPGQNGYFICTNSGMCGGFPVGAQNGIAYLDLYNSGPGSAMQTVTVTRAGTYSFSFWYTSFYGHGSMSVSVGGNAVFNNSNITATSWTQFTTTVTLAAGATSVQFLNNGSQAEGLDTVSLTFLSALVTLLTPNLPSGAPTNVVNVAGAIDNFTNNGGTLPAGFQNLNLYNLSGTQLQTALTQLDGEASTDAEKGAFELMNQFMGLMLDPFVAGRIGSVNGNSIGFAPEQQASFPPDIAQAYASVFKAPPASAPPTQGWTAWGSGFGASSNTHGNGTVGSTNVTAGDYGFAGGMDYHFTPDALAGFALAGAGTTWNLAQGLGGGHSDAFQAGVYTKSYWGPAYVAAALAFSNNWFTTDRSALGDQLQATFNGQSYGGRLESGYRYSVPVSGGVIGATPYAAIQTQWFHTPTYSETDLGGGGLGLSYNAMTANDTRSELGARFDNLTTLDGMPLIMRARLAWAHDWVTNPALTAVFESLPGASFVVNGATPPANSALVSAGAELHMSARWSIAAKFDGEFANGADTYGGSGTLRYTW